MATGNGFAEQFFHGALPDSWRFDDVTDERAAEQPKVVAVPVACGSRQPLAEQVKQEGFEERDQLFAGDDGSRLPTQGTVPAALGVRVACLAGKFLDQWTRDVMRSRIAPLKKVAKTLRDHRDLILNFFHAKKQFSSGVVEGLNNTAKVTMRKAYGFRTFKASEISLYHVLGKLPEPNAAHRCY